MTINELHFVKLTMDLLAVVVAFPILVAGAFSKKRHRKLWARFLLFATGLGGFAIYLIMFLRDMGWVAIGHSSYFEVTYYLADGWLGGWLTALCVSGQITGERQRSAAAGDGEIGKGPV